MITALCLAFAASTLIPAAATTARGGGNATSASKLVGRWERVTTCQDLLAALRKAGLGPTAPAMIAGNGLVPGTPQQLARKTDICKGAVPRRHSHYFTSTGKFGSLDWRAMEVDGGTYVLLGAARARIGGGIFRYRIVGKKLRLTPQITEAAKREALARPLRFSMAGWMVAVSFPGHTWTRVPCAGWC